MKVATGEYTGNGTDDRSISGVGFQPEVVVVKATDAAGPPFRTDAMSGDNANWLRDNNGLTANIIQALESDGFQVGTDGAVNTGSQAYQWFAFADGGDGDLATGTYTGNGTDDRSVTDPGFDVAFVIVKHRGTESGAWRIASNSADNSLQFHQFSAEKTNTIQNFVTNGFEVGTSAEVNTSSEVYDYIAVKSGSSSVAESTYTGNATDDRDITGTGFTPEVVWVKTDDSQAPRANTDGTDDSISLGTIANAANSIQSFASDGFQVGSAADVNSSAATEYWVAFRTAPAVSTFIPKIIMY